MLSAGGVTGVVGVVFFVAADLLVAVFLAVFLAGAFFAAVLLVAVLLAAVVVAVFLAGAFFVAVVAVVLLAAVFFAGAFVAAPPEAAGVAFFAGLPAEAGAAFSAGLAEVVAGVAFFAGLPEAAGAAFSAGVVGAAGVVAVAGAALGVFRAGALGSFGSLMAPETTPLSSLAALNCGTNERFLVPFLAAAFFGSTFSKVPKPLITTFSPRATSRVMVSITASSASAAAFLFPSNRAASASIS